MTSAACRRGHVRTEANTYRLASGRLICRDCRRRRLSEWKKRGDNAVRAKGWIKEWRGRKTETAKSIREAAKSQPCADCGGTFPPYVMDFDHRPGEKKRECVARMPSRRTIKVLQAEIAKCDVVCANCHRIRTHKRKEQGFGSEVKEWQAQRTSSVG